MWWRGRLNGKGECQGGTIRYPGLGERKWQDQKKGALGLPTRASEGDNAGTSGRFFTRGRAELVRIRAPEGSQPELSRDEGGKVHAERVELESVWGKPLN